MYVFTERNGNTGPTQAQACVSLLAMSPSSERGGENEANTHERNQEPTYTRTFHHITVVAQDPSQYGYCTRVMTSGSSRENMRNMTWVLMLLPSLQDILARITSSTPVESILPATRE